MKRFLILILLVLVLVPTFSMVPVIPMQLEDTNQQVVVNNDGNNSQFTTTKITGINAVLIILISVSIILYVIQLILLIFDLNCLSIYEVSSKKEALLHLIPGYPLFNLIKTAIKNFKELE